MKKIYEAPELNLLSIDVQDVISTSGDDNLLDWDITED